MGAREQVNFVLGGAWFTDRRGEMERAVFKGSTPLSVQFEEGKMDFDRNDEVAV